MVSRRMKVYYTTRLNPNRMVQMPRITMTGQWLKEMGFNVGDHIKIKCCANRIVISKKSISV